MNSILQQLDPYFTPFDTAIFNTILPDTFCYPYDYKPHEVAVYAASLLQTHLVNQLDWLHNFGLSKNSDLPIIGKMFGVLVVENEHKTLGYLSAFSGKLAGGNFHPKFVPPVYDMLFENSFLNVGMEHLKSINEEIEILKSSLLTTDEQEINRLKTLRKITSQNLQNLIFDNYTFNNIAGTSKSLRAIFNVSTNKNPPSGAGECAAPKLLQYAFNNKMKPISLAEFWWGQSPKSNKWQHGHFYPCCHEKCKPILTHMLEGIVCDTIP